MRPMAVLDATYLTSSGPTHEVMVVEVDADGELCDQLLDHVSTGIEFGDEQATTSAKAAADRILAQQGWTRTGPWQARADALYADLAHT